MYILKEERKCIMEEKTKTHRFSFQEVKEAAELIIRDEHAREEFIVGVKEVIILEKKLLIMIAAGIVMMFLGILGFLGLILFLTGIVLFGVKVARFTLGENESFMDMFFEKDPE